MARSNSRERLLNAAEALFAERGLAAVSLRAINAAAGLSPAALHYHFGTKAGLVEALLNELSTSSEPPDAAAIIDAFLRPLIELLLEAPEAGHRYIRFLARAFVDGDIDTSFVLVRFEDDVADLDPLLQRALPEHPIDLVRLRLSIAIETGLRTLANSDIYVQNFNETTQLTPAQFSTVLLDFIAGGLAAPSRLADNPTPRPIPIAPRPPGDGVGDLGREKKDDRP
ncbi:MAG: TetR family transcriptional regulator [Deltaproteobacteria bacterium]|nr:TetR family transcriptional regulator [Deltaproteobacteria bacterium]